MKLALAIYGGPDNSQAPQTALNFAKAALLEGHEISRIFFYQDGVHTASTFSTPPQDEQPLTAQWQALIKHHKIEAIVCVAAALRRGIIDAEAAGRYSLSGHNLNDAFALSGLGELIETTQTTARLITFGH